MYPSDQIEISNDEIYKQLTTISSINLKLPKEPIKITDLDGLNLSTFTKIIKALYKNNDFTIEETYQHKSIDFLCSKENQQYITKIYLENKNEITSDQIKNSILEFNQLKKIIE